MTTLASVDYDRMTTAPVPLGRCRLYLVSALDGVVDRGEKANREHGKDLCRRELEQGPVRAFLAHATEDGVGLVEYDRAVGGLVGVERDASDLALQAPGPRSRPSDLSL